MNIDQKKRQQDKFFKGFYPIADDNMRKKPDSELKMKSYKLHFYSLRFAFAVLSFALYVPSIIELFQTSFEVIDHVRNFIIVLILLLLEIGLTISHYGYYISKYSDNATHKRIIVYSLAFTSIILSALSGVNAIDIVDRSETNIITETRTAQEHDIDKYLGQIESNSKRINDINKTFVDNNKNIKDLAPIAATKKGSAQIRKYQQQNDKNQIFIGKLMNQNNHLYKVIENIRKSSKSLMKTRIIKAGKKEFIYMVIFFLSGIIAVAGLMYSYNFIAQYNRHVKNDREAGEISCLEKGINTNTSKANEIQHSKKLNNTEIAKDELNGRKNIQATKPTYKFTDFDRKIMDRLGIPKKKQYIYNAVRQKFGSPIDETKYSGVNSFARNLAANHPNRYQISEIKNILKRIMEFDKIPGQRKGSGQ